jgi:hypothetical protein
VNPFPTLSHGNGLLRGVLNGWSTSGVATFQAGLPLTFSYSNSANVYGVSNDRASFAPGCKSSNIGTPGSVNSKLNSYFKTSCFVTPAIIGDDGLGTDFGNTGAGILRGPDQRNFDLSLIKRTRLGQHWESANVEFRAEAFNAFNTTQFANPNTGFGTAGFGSITETLVAPRIMQLALKVNF